MSEMEVYPSKRNLFIALLLAIAFFMAVYFLPEDDPRTKVDWFMIYLSLGLSGAVALVFGWKLLR